MSSRFKELFEEVKQEPVPAIKTVKETVREEEEIKISAAKPARVKGKRSNPDYIGAFAYIPGKLHEDVKVKLLRKKDLDFSGLVEDLLAKWLDEQK